MGNGIVKEKVVRGILTDVRSKADSAKFNAAASMPVASNARRTLKSAHSGDPRPLPVGGDEEDEEEEKRNPSRKKFASLSDVLGPPDSKTALYIKKKTIGKGAFAEAYIVERNPLFPLFPRGEQKLGGGEAPITSSRAVDNGPRFFVAKVMDLTSTMPSNRGYAQTEIMCLSCNHHFAIVHYYEHYFVEDGDETIIIITEFADGGDLHRILYKDHANSFLSEEEVGMYFVQLLLGLDHIHSRRMIHRDIKAANIFLTTRGLLKLGDFGFSQQYDSTVSNPIACTFLGTSYYVAPEMWRAQRYGKKADIWAAGVVLCELLGRRRPFEADSLPKMKDLVLSGHMWLPPTFPENFSDAQMDRNSRERAGYISEEMREFLESILQRDPDKRPSASQLLKTRLMRHYLCLFKRHVNSMIASDDELKRKYEANPGEFGGSFPDYNLSLKDKSLVLEGIAEGERVISLETERDVAKSTSPRIEGTIYKEGVGGQWKERYLILADGFLTMTLAEGKRAAGWSERSKKVSLHSMNSVSPYILDAPVVVESGRDAEPIYASYAFAISTQKSQSIVFATRLEEERDQWLSALMSALNMD